MKQFCILAFLLFSFGVFSQTKVDSVLCEPSMTSSLNQKIDMEQIKRIDNIEQRLTAFHTQNRRAQTLMYIGMGLTLFGSILNDGESTSSGIVLPLTGVVVSFFGTAIYLDSYKHLNFKPKKKQLRTMTYY